MRLRPWSSTALATGGAIRMALGLYFAFARPALLPEDARFMGASIAKIQSLLPAWLIGCVGCSGSWAASCSPPVY